MSLNTFEMCRSCGDFDLPKQKKLIPIFRPGKLQNLIGDIKNTLISCWEIPITEDDGLPKHICSTCLAKFDAYFSLRTFCRKTQHQFNTLFKKMSADRAEKCLINNESTCTNNEEINTNEGAKKSSFCNKKRAKIKTMRLKAQDNPINDSEIKDLNLKSIEFVGMPIKISKNQPKGEDCIVHCNVNTCDELDPIELLKSTDYMKHSEELQYHEVIKKLNNDKEDDCERHTTVIKQPVLQMETNCEVLLEGEISESEFDNLNNYDSFENENTVSTGNNDYEENNIYQAQTDEKHKKLTNKKSHENYLVCKYCCFDEDISPNDVVFESKEALSAHIKLQHDPSSPYTCQTCKKKYGSLKKCRRHILYIHKKQKTICWKCGIEMNITHLKSHMHRFHTIGDFQCETCGKKFKNISVAVFKYHKRWHNKKNQHKCEFCGKIFVVSGHLKTHMLVHTKDYYIKCDKCEKGFRSKYDKGMHMHRIHGDALPIKCLYCDERFALYQKRTNHMINMHGHVKNITDEKLKCLKCNKNFRRETGLRNHMKRDCQIKKKTTPVPNIKKHTCQQCSRTFGKKSALIKHIPLHSNEGRPYQCNVCQLHYKTHSHLDIHRRLKHSNEKPFACDICGKKFALRFCLNEHRSFHKV